MQVLVTGATGFLGRHLVRRLLDDGVQVRVLARSPSRAQQLVEEGADLVVGEITDPVALASALRNVEVVYHLAGKLLAPGVADASYRSTHVDGTRALLACCDQVRLKRFVHCSTTGVLGVTGDIPADETAVAAPTNVYEQTKWEAEEMVRRAIDRGFPAAIARPGLVYGPGDLHLLGFFQAIRRRYFRPIGSRSVWLHPIYISDLIEALVRCASHPRAVGECFHLAGQEPVTLLTLASTIADSLGAPLPAGTIPVPIARAAAMAGDMMPTGLKRLAPLTSNRLDFLTHSRVYDVAKARRLLGYAAVTDLPSGIARSVAWYRQHGYLPAPRPPATHQIRSELPISDGGEE